MIKKQTKTTPRKQLATITAKSSRKLCRNQLKGLLELTGHEAEEYDKNLDRIRTRYVLGGAFYRGGDLLVKIHEKNHPNVTVITLAHDICFFKPNTDIRVYF